MKQEGNLRLSHLATRPDLPSALMQGQPQPRTLVHQAMYPERGTLQPSPGGEAGGRGEDRWDNSQDQEACLHSEANLGTEALTELHRCLARNKDRKRSSLKCGLD